MIKNINLQGTWNFCLDAECKGVDNAFYTKKPEDTITLPGTLICMRGTPGTQKRYISSRRI